MKPSRTVLVLGPTIAALLFVSAEVGADASKRRSLRDEIDRYLSDIAGELRDVPGDSSTSDLDRTVDYAGRVAEKANDLKIVAEDDSDARKIAEYYPAIAGRYRDHVRYLREMKTQQRRTDEWPRKCTDAARELESKLQSLTSSHTPRGVEEVPKLAREYGKIGKDGLEQVERLRYEMAQFYDRVDDFSDSEGKWSDVRSYLHAAGRTMYEGVTRHQEQMKRDDVCGNLAKEERNPVVERAMQKLLEGKAGIETIYAQVDRLLGETAGYLDGLVGDSNASDVEQARRKLDEVERMADQLDRIKGNDDDAKRRMEMWKAQISAGRAALDQLKVLKEAQFLADRAPEKCRETERQLEDVIRGFVDRKNMEGVRVIPLRARGFAEPIKAGLQKTDEQHGLMERALSEAQRFSPSDGAWRAVGERHRGSAQAVFEYWTKARTAAHGACDELATGDQQRRVKEAIDRLKGGADAEIDVFKRDVEAWNADARTLFLLDCTELENIWTAMCGADEEPNEWPDRDEARQVAREIGGRMKGRIDPMLVRYTALKRRGDDLAAEAETKDRANAIMKTMDEIHAKFERLQQGGALKGNDHPMSQYAAAHGRQMHDDYGGRYSCTVYDKTYPEAGGRPDCVVIASGACKVLEFKPDTPGQDAKAATQLARYVPAVKKYYQLRIDGKMGDDSSDIGKFTSLVEKNCMSGTSVVFGEGKVKYPLCEKKFECTR